jgi:hypothetical protein
MRRIRELKRTELAMWLQLLPRVRVQISACRLTVLNEILCDIPQPTGAYRHILSTLLLTNHPTLCSLSYRQIRYRRVERTVPVWIG